MSDDFTFQNKEDVIIFKLGRLEALLGEIQIQLAANALVLSDANKRISSLERSRSYAYGLVATVAAIITITVNALARFVHI